MPSEQIAVTLLVVDALEQVGARYVVSGSLASAIHGVVRTTLDTDIVADLALSQAQPLADLLGGAFYLDLDTMRDAISERGSFNLIHLQTMFKVDIFVARARRLDRQELARRQAWVADPATGRSLYIATAEDTVLAKLVWYRLGGEVSDRQWRDILGVLSVQGQELDVDYLRDSAAELQVDDLLKRAVADTT
jgi:hypothetical protein